MSLKPVELQIALPRSTEAGKMQNEAQQRPAIDQQQLAGQNVKQSLELTMRSSEVDESSESALRDDGGHANYSGDNSSSSKHSKPEGTRDAEHPYKGHRIDLSL